MPCFLPCVAGAWERGETTFAQVEERARALATEPYKAVDKEALPAWMKALTYDQYRDIRFRPEVSLWGDVGNTFRAQFFHPGYIYREPVMLHEFTDTHRQEVRFTKDFFTYGALVGENTDHSGDAGFAGFRFMTDFGRGTTDELAVFQGASYWRCLSKDTRYGLSARGLAIDTGSEGRAEEFPRFSEYWLQKPKSGDPSVKFFALLDSPSVSGAYEFAITPGDDTVVHVRAVLYPRTVVQRFGVAPLSSMYWFGENSKRRFDDFRPEVHDSDGLAVRMASGERVWRPLVNDSGRLEFSFLDGDGVKGFGLVQRDRRFAAYEDGEAAYDLRPSVWMEPTNDWGKGKVMLMEIPTNRELDDNIVATWVPDVTPVPGQRYEFTYRQIWTSRADPADAGGIVVATRTGVHEWEPEQRTVIVEFEGGGLANIASAEELTAVVEMSKPAEEKLEVNHTNIQKMSDGRWRLSFRFTPKGQGDKLAEVGATELRCCLKKGEDYLTETWVYRIQP